MLHLGSHTTKALDHMWLSHQCSLLGKLGSCRHPSWRNLGGCNDKSMGTVCTKFLSFKMPASSKFQGKFLRRFLRHEARLKLCNNTVRTFLAKLGLLACLCPSPSCFFFFAITSRGNNATNILCKKTQNMPWFQIAKLHPSARPST